MLAKAPVVNYTISCNRFNLMTSASPKLIQGNDTDEQINSAVSACNNAICRQTIAQDSFIFSSLQRPAAGVWDPADLADHTWHYHTDTIRYCCWLFYGTTRTTKDTLQNETECWDRGKVLIEILANLIFVGITTSAVNWFSFLNNSNWYNNRKKLNIMAKLWKIYIV